MSDTIEKVIFLILGWLLGLLAPVIVDQIKTRRENKLGRTAVIAELCDVAVLFAFAKFTIDMRSPGPARPKVEWIVSRQEALGDNIQRIDDQKAVLKFPDSQLDAYYDSKRSRQSEALTLRKYRTPMLDARVPAIWTFDVATLRALLEIRAAIEIANDTVDRAMHYTNLTFQLEGENHSRARSNVEDAYSQYARQAEYIVSLVIKLRDQAR